MNLVIILVVERMVEVVAMVEVEEGVDEVATVVVDKEEEAAAVDHPFVVVGKAAVCGRLPWGRPWRRKKETRNKTSSRPHVVVVGSVGGTARSRRYLSLV
eukprot:scaffold90317_cov34-Attheya_sp.AAC.2